MSGGGKNKVEYQVHLLDDTTISCRVEKSAKGEELVEQVNSFLELSESEFFGICFSHPKQRDQTCWLQAKKPINKQIGSVSSTVFQFRVKFYPPDPNLVQKEATRYLFVCQLKKDLQEERLTCSVSTECLLASYALQAEVGDYDREDELGSYIQGGLWFSVLTPSLEQSIRDTHKSLRGLSPASADQQFLNIARKLELYGIHKFEAMDKTSSRVSVAVVWNGVHIYRCGTHQTTYQWARVYKLDFKGRHFYIILKSTPEGGEKETFSLKFSSKHSSKIFWRRCVEYHAFFRLKRREHAQMRANAERQKQSSATFSRGTPLRSTISTPMSRPPHGEISSQFSSVKHSTPRSKEAEDVVADGTSSCQTFERQSSGEVRGYSTLPPAHRRNECSVNTTGDSLSSKFNSSVISVDSGSYNLGTSQDCLSTGFGATSTDRLFSAEPPSDPLSDLNREKLAALTLQINQKMGNEQGEEEEEERIHHNTHHTNGTSTLIKTPEPTPPPQPPPPQQPPQLLRGASVSSIQSRTSSRTSLNSNLGTLDLPDTEFQITIPLDLILDVGKSIPDQSFSNYLARYTRYGYSRLHAVSQEFIFTEKTFVKILGVLNTFLREITGPNGPFGNSQVLLLSNFYEMHQKFLRQLEDRLSTVGQETKTLNISDILARNIGLFTLYTEYVKDYHGTMESFNKCLQEESVFAKHVEMFEARSSSVISIPNLLLYPVLRVKQYQELADRLLGCVNESDPSHPDLYEVFHEINKHTPNVTQDLPKIMNFTVLQSLETELIGIREIPNHGRVFLRRGVVRQVLGPGRALTRSLVLLSDCLLCCRSEREKQGQLTVIAMYHVRDIEVEETKDENVFSFVVTLPAAEQSMEFQVDEARDAETWIHDIRFSTSIFKKRPKPENLPVLVETGLEQAPQELCMVCGITLGRDRRHRSCRLCKKVLCTRCSSWKISLSGFSEMQRVCENCYSRGDTRQRDLEVTQYTVQPPLISYGGDDLLTMEQLSGYVFVRSQSGAQWRRRWLELIFTKLFFYEADDDVKPLGALDMLHLQVTDTRYEDQVSANYAFKITSKSFSIVIATETSYSLKRWLSVLEKATLALGADSL